MPTTELRIPIAPELDAAKTNSMVQKMLAAFKKFTGANLPKLDGESLGINDLLQQASKLAGEFDQNAASLNKLADEGKKALAVMLQGGKQNTVQFQQQVEEVKRVTAEIMKMKDAQSEIDKLTGGGGGDDSGGFLQKAANISLVADGLGRAGELFDSVSEKGNEYNQTMKNLSVTTGLTGDALDELKARGEDAFRNGLGENVAEATKAAGTAQAIFKDILTPEDQAGFLQVAGGIGKAYDVEVNEVLAKSRTFIQSFKLDGVEGGNLIALTMQRAGSAADDVLDTLNEYSPLMAKAGVQGDQFADILSRGVEAGVRNTDLLGDAIKETGIRLQAGDISKGLEDIQTPITATIAGIVKAGEEGSKSTAQVLQESSAAIETAFNAGKISDTMRSQLQVAVSGTPGEEIGAELYGKIFSAPIDTKSIAARAATAGDVVVDAIAPSGIFNKLGKELDIVTTKASAMFAPFLAGAGNVLGTVAKIGPGLALAFEKGPELASKLLPVLTGLVPSLGAVATAEGAVGVAGSAAWSAVLAPLLPIVAAVAAVVGSLYLAYQNVESFREGVDSLVASVEEVVTAIIEWVTTTYNEIKPALEELVKVAIMVGKIIFDYITLPIRLVIGAIGTVIGWIGKLISSLFKSKDGAKAAGDGMSGLSKVVSVVVKFLKGLQAEVAGVGAALSFAGGVFGDFINALVSFDADTILHAFDNFFGRLTGAYEKGKADFQREAARAPIEVPETEVENTDTKTGGVVIPKTTPPKKTDTAAVSAAAKALKAYNDEIARLDKERKSLENTEKEARARDGITQSLVDQILDEKERLDIQKEQLRLADELVAKTNALASATDDEKKAAQAARDAAQERVTTQSTTFLTLRAKLIPEVDEARLRELERERLKLQIELGTRPGTDMLAFLRGDLAILEKELADTTGTRAAELAEALTKQLITQAEYDKELAALGANASQAQVEALNKLAAKRKEIRDIEYAAELKRLDEIDKARDKQAAREAERLRYQNENALRLLEQSVTFGLDKQASERLAALESLHDRELIAEEEFTFKREEIERAAQERQAAAAEAFRGAQIEAERQAALDELAIQQDKLLQRRAAAEAAGRQEDVLAIDKQLGDIADSMEEKGGVLTGLASTLQGNLTEIFGSLISGDEEKVKDPFRRSFGVLAGALQQLATAKITEVILGSLNGLTGIPGMLASLASGPVISATINAILSPILKGLLSFPTGGRIDAPTLALVGDASRLGATNREWIFRDDQLRQLMSEASGGGMADLVAEVRGMRADVRRGTDREYVLDGTDLVLSATRTRTAMQKRIINPPRDRS